VATELEAGVAGKTVNQRRIVVRRLREGEAPQGVHLLSSAARAQSARRTALRPAATASSP
jgi:hypothetical protein